MRKALEIEENFGVTSWSAFTSSSSHISPGDDGPGLWLWLKLSVDGNLGSSNDVRRLFLSLSSRSTQKWIEDENKKSTQSEIVPLRGWSFVVKVVIYPEEEWERSKSSKCNRKEQSNSIRWTWKRTQTQTHRFTLVYSKEMVCKLQMSHGQMNQIRFYSYRVQSSSYCARCPFGRRGEELANEF